MVNLVLTISSIGSNDFVFISSTLITFAQTYCLTVWGKSNTLANCFFSYSLTNTNLLSDVYALNSSSPTKWRSDQWFSTKSVCTQDTFTFALSYKNEWYRRESPSKNETIVSYFICIFLCYFFFLFKQEEMLFILCFV